MTYERPYGKAIDPRADLLTTHTLTYEQAWSLYKLAQKAPIEVVQTWTKSGGTHLYVRGPDGDEFHIAKNGNIVDLGSRG